MAVSKHNLWKRKKNGLMKLVRSHSDWLERRRKTRVRKRNVVAEKKQWWEKKSNTPTTTSKGVTSSTKRTQIGKKI